MMPSKDLISSFQVSVPSSVNMAISSIVVFRQGSRVSTRNGSNILFLLNFFKKIISVNSYLLNILTFKVIIISNSSVCNDFYDGGIRIQQERIKHFFPSNKNRQPMQTTKRRRCLQKKGALSMKILRQITYQKEKKTKQEIPTSMTSALLKNSTENNNNGPGTGQKRSITNNGGGNNPPTKVS